MCFFVQLPAISGHSSATADNSYFVARSTGAPPWAAFGLQAHVRAERWATRNVQGGVSVRGPSALLPCTKSSCIWSTDCCIIGTALDANVKEPGEAKRAGSGRKACGSRLNAALGVFVEVQG